VTAVVAGSPADAAGLSVGDEILAINGQVPTDVLEYRWLTDDADPELEVRSGLLERTVVAAKAAGVPLGVEVNSAVFDRVMTCDNHCAFCFIHQLPPGVRPSLRIKDDDYRLSFLYGNFTTLTRFTEADLERVVGEGLSPLHVSIHATDPGARAGLLRNRRGAVSLRWLRVLLDAGVVVHGQVVVCPGVNDGARLADTLLGVLDAYPELASVCVVPLGVSRFNREDTMRAHTPAEANAVVDLVHAAQVDFLAAVGRRVVFAADEYYLLAGRHFPAAGHYEGFPMHEDGVGMAASFAAEFAGAAPGRSPAPGFFAAVDGAPAAGYRAPRLGPAPTPTARGCGAATSAVPVSLRAPAGMGLPVGGGATQRHSLSETTILTSTYGAAVLTGVLVANGYGDVEVLAVENGFFGGTTAVTGLLTGSDLEAGLAGRDPNRRYLLPDVCLSQGRFLDDTTPGDLPVAVEVVPTDGASLRRVLDGAPVA